MFRLDIHGQPPGGQTSETLKREKEYIAIAMETEYMYTEKLNSDTLSACSWPPQPVVSAMNILYRYADTNARLHACDSCNTTSVCHVNVVNHKKKNEMQKRYEHKTNTRLQQNRTCV